MPPKPNPANNNPKPQKTDPVGDLQKELQEKKELLAQEQANRNFFQLERDKINAFWEITKKELENVKAEFRNKEREMEEREERHQVELKVYKQKVRHLLYEQKITIDRLKIESENALKLQAEEFRQKMQQLKNDKRALKQELKAMEVAHADTIKTLNLNNDRNISIMREQFERKLKELQQKYETKMDELRQDLELRAKKEAEEIEERKNTHIKELMNKHEQAFKEIKNYYNVITANNLVLIKSLKDEVASMKKSEAGNEKLMFEISRENKKLSEPLSVALAEIDMLRKEVANQKKDKQSLDNAKSRLVTLEGQLKELRWEHEILEQSHKQVQKERDELYHKFEKTIHDIQQKALFKNQLLETKIQTLHETLEKKDAQLREIIKSSKLGDDTVDTITSNITNVVDEKNREIHDLQFETEKLKKMYNDLYAYTHKKMQQYGIPLDETQFDRVVPPVSPQQAPATPLKM